MSTYSKYVSLAYKKEGFRSEIRRRYKQERNVLLGIGYRPPPETPAPGQRSNDGYRSARSWTVGRLARWVWWARHKMLSKSWHIVARFRLYRQRSLQVNTRKKLLQQKSSIICNIT